MQYINMYMKYVVRVGTHAILKMLHYCMIIATIQHHDYANID